MKTRRWRIIFFFLVLFTTFFIFSYRINPEKNSLVAFKPEKISLKMYESVYYEVCSHTEYRETYLIEQQLNDYFSNYRNWKVTGFNEEEIRVMRRKAGICSTCTKWEFMGVYNNSIAIYYGKPDKRGPVKEVTDIRILNLPIQEIKDLEKGIEYSSLKEKLFILESYQE